MLIVIMESAKIQWNEKYKFQLYLICIGLFVFFNSLFGAFVWDDIAQIQQNHLIQSLTNLPQLFTGSTYGPVSGASGSGGYYRPLMSLVFTIIYSFFGSNVFFFHLTQLSLHIVNALLIFILFKKIFKEPLAFTLALLFLIHPLTTESVDYMSALGEPLFVLFGLLSMYIFQQKNSIKHTLITSLFLFFTLLAKETGVVFLVLIVCYYVLFGRKQWKLLTVFLITVLPLLMYLFLRFSIAHVHVDKYPDVPMMTAPLGQRIFTMPAIFWHYIYTFFIPKDLVIFQQWFISSPTKEFYLPLFFSILFVGICIFVAINLLKKNKKSFLTFLFFFAWLLTGIFIHLQFLPLDFTVADRYFYFGMIGLLGMIGVVIDTYTSYIKPTLKTTGMVLLILIIVIFSIRTIVRNANWQSGLALYSHDLMLDKTNDRLENWLAIEQYNSGDFSDAKIHFENLLVRNPSEPALYNNLASIYTHDGNIDKAIELLQKVADTDGTGDAYLVIGKLLFNQGKIQEAKMKLLKGFKEYPNNGNLLLMDALCEYRLGNKDQAVQTAEKGKQLTPGPAADFIYTQIKNDQVTW